jgi:hypothetical protein
MTKSTAKTTKRTGRIMSAAAALGGKMSETVVRMPITNVTLGDDYTGVIHVGTDKAPLNVLLDTGSSTLAIDGTAYDVTKDKTAKVTEIAQEIAYADGSNWMGGLVLVDVAVGTGKKVALPQVHVAVAYHATSDMFGKSQGILGLAYTKLNNAYVMPGPTIPPQYTYNQIQTGKVTYVEPYFTQLESAGLVANKFAFYTKRSIVNMATANPETDPLNNGFLILGGGEESTDLYTGSFQVARVVHDTYYNTNLKSIAVGSSAPIPVPSPTKASGNASNSVVDSGTNGIMLDQKLFDAVVEDFPTAALRDEIRAGYAAMNKLDLADWPTITFVLEGALGKDVSLQVAPNTYWQTDAPKKGRATAVMYGDSGQGGGQSILGLPLMNNYFTVFDRSVDKGLGVVSFAKIK